MNYVYLESKYNEFYLNDEAYAQIVAIVQANKYCMYDYRDRHPYTKDNPCVGKNICLEHLLQKQRNLTRLDVVGTNADRPVYYFTDTQGYVYTSIEDSSDEARMDMLETLSFYGFIPPKTRTMSITLAARPIMAATSRIPTRSSPSLRVLCMT